jgi:myo-inositol 2-dehydrogenase / D-chiro-inositol 1-dehydrogenase
VVAGLLDQVRAGACGPTRMVSIREHRFPFLVKVGDWNRFNRNTGGTLVEKCCHFFDLMRLVADAEPVRVMASGGQAVNHLDELYDGEVPDICDHAFVIVDFANGVRGALDLSMFAEGGRHEQEICVVGDTGKLEADFPGDTVWFGPRDRSGPHRIDAPTPAEVPYPEFHGGASWFELHAFCDAVTNGTPAEVTVDDGLWSVAIGAAAHRSIDEGRVVEIAELFPDGIPT